MARGNFERGEILFLSTLSLRRATVMARGIFERGAFLSTLSLRRATSNLNNHSGGILDFYPRSPCGERLYQSILPPVPYSISIHALLAESDTPATRCWSCRRDFYPRSPCGERRNMERRQPARPYFYPRSPCGERRNALRKISPIAAFLSTLSLRRATLHPLCVGFMPAYFYPRSPCGERPQTSITTPVVYSISIHALLAESDSSADEFMRFNAIFLSTLSLRRATAAGRKCGILPS